MTQMFTDSNGEQSNLHLFFSKRNNCGLINWTVAIISLFFVVLRQKLLEVFTVVAIIRKMNYFSRNNLFYFAHIPNF